MAPENNIKSTFLCRYKKDEVYIMTSLLHLKTANCTGPIRPSQRKDIPRMHFTGVNMLILAQQPMAVHELCSRYRTGWIRLRDGDTNSVRAAVKGGQRTLLDL